MMPAALLDLAIWVPILDGDRAAADLYERHYSARKSLSQRRMRGTNLFVGPGQKLILSTPCRRALFAWRWSKFRPDNQSGIECAIFRNEGAGLSSDLIRAADAIADARWPDQRHFTYIDPKRVASPNAGYCFAMAGWHRAGHSKRGLIIMDRAPPILSPDVSHAILRGLSLGACPDGPIPDHMNAREAIR